MGWFRRKASADDVPLPPAEDAARWAKHADAAFDAASSAADSAGMRAAADLYRRSLELTGADDPALDERTVNLALSLSRLGRSDGDPAALDEAIGAFEAVLATTHADDDRLPLRQCGLAVALTGRGKLRGDTADLARADATVALIPAASTQRASAHFLIGDEWVEEFARSNAVHDLDRAIEEYRQAVAASVAGDERVGGRRARYAMLLANRAAAFDNSVQRAEAIDQLRLSRDELAAGEVRDAVALRLGRLLLDRATQPDDTELDDTELDEAEAAARLPAGPSGATEAEEAALAIAVSRQLRTRADEAAAAAGGDVDPHYVRAIELLEHRRTTADGTARVALVTELTAVHCARSERRGDDGPLLAAIEVLRKELDHDLRDGDSHRQLAAALSRHFERFGAAASLAAAIGHAEQAVTLATTDDALIDALATLGGGRVLAALADADYDSLDAIYESCYERAITLSGGVASARPGLLNDAAIALREAGVRRHDPAKLDQAIELLGTVLSAQRSPAALTNLANALGDRYRFDSDLSGLDEAIEVARAAVAGTAPGDGYHASRVANLGHLLVDRYQAAGNLQDIDDAIASYTQAVAEQNPNASAAAGHVAALASAVRYRFWATGDRKDLQMACRCDADAVRRTPPTAAERPRRLAGLAASLMARWAAEHDPVDLDDAVEALGNALALAEYDDAARVNWAARLGDAYARRSRLSDDRDARSARQWFTHSLALADDRGGDYASALDAARYWQSWAARHTRWDEAAEAGRRGLRFAGQLDRTQVTRADRETRLSAVGALGAETAYALAQLADLEAAAVTMESARAVLLSDSLQLDDTELEALTATAPALVAAYRAADERRRSLTRPQAPASAASAATAADRARARSTRTDFDVAVAAIRRVPGYEHFQSEPTLAAIAEAAEVPVVYLVPARSGGLALIVTGERQVADVALPQLRRDDLERHAAHYFEAYAAARGAPDRRIGWHQQLDEITAWLWDAVMDPLVASLDGAARIRVIAAGRLGVLPLHAAWTPDAGRPTGRRYALDDVAISYAPNARSLARRHATLASTAALAVVEPRPVPAGPLPGARFEALAMSATAPVEVTTVAGGAATRRRFLRESADADVLHLACHAYADLSSPLDSGLLLADGPFRLRDLLHAHPIEARLAVLSACESGVVDRRLPDESVALSTGLVQAGVAGVIATQWSVPDGAAAMLMAEFYQRWQWGAQPVPDALRSSQQWLRDTPNAEKRRSWTARAAAGTLPKEVAEFFADSTLGLEPAEREHAHVHSWGAFTHTGV